MHHLGGRLIKFIEGGTAEDSDYQAQDRPPPSRQRSAPQIRETWDVKQTPHKDFLRKSLRSTATSLRFSSLFLPIQTSTAWPVRPQVRPGILREHKRISFEIGLATLTSGVILHSVHNKSHPPRSCIRRWVGAKRGKKHESAPFVQTIN